MGISKQSNWQDIISPENIFIFLFLVIFPFGQIIRLSFNLFGINVPLQPIDVVVGMAALWGILKRYDKPLVFKSIINFLNIAFFSFIVSIFIFKTTSIAYGLFYLTRVAAYLYFLIYVWNFAKKSLKNKKLLIDSLLGVSVASAVFGWIQFFMIPDIKALFIYGWDIHLFRLVGTFLDPTFLGLIIVFGLLISIYKFIRSKNWKWILLITFLLISLAFTYSRASYLAFAAGILTIIYLEKKFKKLVLLIIGLGVIAFLLPTTRNHSIEIFRSFSVIAKADNYQTTLKIFSKSPVFGIGYDNMCIAYQKYIGIQDFSSHACSGSDSSLLLILATTGIVGLMIFLNLIINIAKSLGRSEDAKIFIAVVSALFVHSLFSNSLFYPWIIGYVIIFLAISLRE